MLTWLVRGVVAIALINLATLVALHVAYAWHHWLSPRRTHRRARQRSFERLLAESIMDNREPSPAHPVAALDLAGEDAGRPSDRTTDTTARPALAPSVFRMTSLTSANR